MEGLVYALAIIYGLIIGSFLNVLILRIPNRENFVTERSHCVTCGYQLSWYDMIPVISYLCLRGRCRKCGERISVQYPLVEGLNAILYFVIFYVNGISVLSSIYCFVSSALLVIAVIDFRTYEIPLGLTVFIGVMGIVCTAMDHTQIPLHVIGMFSVGLVLEIMFLVSGGTVIGGGDATLMMAAGLVLGWKKITLAFFLACVIGAIIHSIRMKVSKADHVLALGPYLALGIYICMVWGDQMIQWYLRISGLDAVWS